MYAAPNWCQSQPFGSTGAPPLGLGDGVGLGVGLGVGVGLADGDGFVPGLVAWPEGFPDGFAEGLPPAGECPWDAIVGAEVPAVGVVPWWWPGPDPPARPLAGLDPPEPIVGGVTLCSAAEVWVWA